MTPPISVCSALVSTIHTVVRKFRSEPSTALTTTLQPISSMFLLLYLQVGRQVGRPLAYFAVSIGKTRRFSRFQRGFAINGINRYSKTLVGNFHDRSPPLIDIQRL